jgi:hypothetical protein
MSCLLSLAAFCVALAGLSVQTVAFATTYWIDNAYEGAEVIIWRHVRCPGCGGVGVAARAGVSEALVVQMHKACKGDTHISHCRVATSAQTSGELASDLKLVSLVDRGDGQCLQIRSPSSYAANMLLHQSSSNYTDPHADMIKLQSLTWASVFATMKSTPVMVLPAFMLLTAFEPPPPTPTTYRTRISQRFAHRKYTTLT